jgi:hypothetical protein
LNIRTSASHPPTPLETIVTFICGVNFFLLLET